MSTYIQYFSMCSFFVQKSMALDMWMDGWVGGYMDRWVGGRAGLRIAYSNLKYGEVLTSFNDKLGCVKWTCFIPL